MPWIPGVLPMPLGHPPVAMVSYYLCTSIEKFPVQIIQRHRNAPRPPTEMSNFIRDEQEKSHLALRLWWRKRGAIINTKEEFP